VSPRALPAPSGALLAAVLIGLCPAHAAGQGKVVAARAPEQKTALVVQAGHATTGTMAVSPDGKLLALTGPIQGGRFEPEATLRAADGRLLRVIRTGLDQGHSRVDFSPDGGLIAVSGSASDAGGCAVELYDVDTGARAGAIRDTPMGERLEAVFLADGRRMAACGWRPDGKAFLCVYDLAGRLLRWLALPDGSKPFGLVVIPGGSKVACLLDGARFAVTDLESGDGVLAADPEVARRAGAFIRLAAAPDGRTLAVCADVPGERIEAAGGMSSRHVYPLSLWSADGTLVRRLREQASETDGPSVQRVIFHGGALLMALDDAAVENLGDVITTRQRFAVLRIPLDGGAAATIAAGDDYLADLGAAGGRIVAACAGGVRSWDADGAHPAAAWTGDAFARAFVSFSPDGARFLSCAWSVQVWNADGRLERVIEAPRGAFVYGAAFSPDGEIVVAHSKGIDVRSTQGALLRHLDAFEGWGRHGDRIRTDGRHVFVPVTDADVEAIDAKSFQIASLPTVPGPLLEPGPDGAWIALYSGLGWGSRGDVLLLRSANRGWAAAGSAAIADAYGLGVSSSGIAAWVRAGPDRAAAPVLHVLGRDGAARTTALTGLMLASGFSTTSVAVSAGGAVAIASRDRPDVRLVRPDGSQRDLIGAGAGLLALAFSPDGKRLAAVGADATVRAWNLATGDAVTSAADGGEWVAFTDDGWFDASADGGRLLAIVRGREAYGVEQMALYRNRPDILLSRLGVGGAEARDLYFRRYVWRLVKAGLVPQSIPAAEYESRVLGPSDPDGRARLKACYEWKADAYRLKADAGLGDRIALFGVPAFLARIEAALAAGASPPVASIASATPVSEGLTLSCSFRSSVRPLRSYNVFIDGVPVFPGAGEPLAGTKALVTTTVALPPGPSRVEVSCVDAGMAESPRAGVDADGGPRQPGTLWYVGFGVSEYRSPDLRLLYPGKDVRDLRDALLAQKGRWRDVRAWAFTDSACTAESVRKAKALLADARPGDTVVLLVSGHGLHDSDPDSTYYFLTHEADLSDIPRTAVSFSVIESLLDGIAPTRKLFLMDTCESGEYDEMAMASVSPAAHLVVRGLPRRGTAGRGTSRASAPRVFVQETDRYIHRDLFQRTGAVVFSSSRAGEYSYEPDELLPGENGFFTGAVLKALTTPVADADGDGAVSVAELRAYAAAAVADRSDGCQHPTVDRDNPAASISFPLPDPDAARMPPSDAAAYLAAAARGGNPAVVRSLLSRASAFPRSALDRALVEAASAAAGSASGALACVKALLAAGADPGAADAAGIPAAVAAWRAGRPSVSAALVEAGARLPAFMVAESSLDATVKAAVEAAASRGARVDRTDLQEAFWRSVQLGDPSAALLLLKTGADFQDAWHGRDAVRAAGDYGFPALAAALSRQRALTAALVAAASDGDLAAARAAVAGGAFVNARLGGTTALITAAAAGRTEAAALLLAAGAEPDGRGWDGQTALIEAARAGMMGCVRLLLDAGADPSLRTSWNETALSLAEKAGFAEVAGLLKARGAR
jgi:ankyrin repeat protein/WD40 repeat protein